MELLRACILGAAVALYACNAPTPERQPQPVALPSAATGDTGAASGDTVARRPLPDTTAPLTPETTAPPVNPAQAATEAMVVPTGALYVCLSGAGTQQQTVIEFPPGVGELCRKHPEMGPCQYERDACRRSGGRVFAADGKEITKLTEAEYDKHVLRVKINSN